MKPLRCEGFRLFHGHDGQNLEQVVLHHVIQWGGGIVIAASGFHAHVLQGGNLYGFNMPGVPDVGENGVGEADGLDVAHHLLAQVVVDAVDLLRPEVVLQRPIQRLGGR